MSDVPSIAVLCSESVECFPGTASKFFLRLLVTIPMAPILLLLLSSSSLLRVIFGTQTVVTYLIRIRNVLGSSAGQGEPNEVNGS